MNKLLAFLWLVIVGTNSAQYYSVAAPYQGAVILLGAGYFSLVYRTELLRVLFYKDFLLVLFALSAPLLLMSMSPLDFERGLYTSQLSLALIFVVAAALILAGDLDGAWIAAAFVIVATGTAMNLYELFVENNRW